METSAMKALLQATRRNLVVTAALCLTLVLGVAMTASAHGRHHCHRARCHARHHGHGARHHGHGARHRAVRTPAAMRSSDAPCAGSDLMPSDADIGQVHSATLCLINKERAHAGLPAVMDSAKLDHAASGHSQDMVGRGYFDHVSPTGSTPVTRMLGVGYISPRMGYLVGENIAWGTHGLATPAAIVNAWMHSADHRANILQGAYRQSGIGVSPSAPRGLGGGQPGAIYTQDFGVRR